MERTLVIKSSRVIIAFLIVLCTTSPICAMVQPEAFSITPSLGRYTFDSDIPRGKRTELTYGFSLGYDVTPRLSLEIFRMNQEIARMIEDEPVLFSRDIYFIESLYAFKSQYSLVPFVLAGIGVPHYGGGVGGNSDVVVDYGVGVRYALREGIFLRGEIKRFVFLDDPTLHDFEYLIGISFYPARIWPISKRPAPAPIPIPAPEPVPVPAPEPEPIPAPEPEPEPALPPPSEPEPIPVPVPEPEPQAPAPVDRFDFYITFDFNKAEIKPQAEEEVKELAEWMNLHPDIVAELAGHTDNIGAERVNQLLSLRRAEAVKKQLIARYGINPARVITRGYGETMPITKDQTVEGRKQNRRVVTILTAP